MDIQSLNKSGIKRIKLTSGYRAPRTRTVIDTRVQSKTSNNSTWLHALGFVVLAAIVISWALGY